MDRSHEIITNLFKNYLVSSTEEKDLSEFSWSKKGNCSDLWEMVLNWEVFWQCGDP